MLGFVVRRSSQSVTPLVATKLATAQKVHARHLIGVWLDKEGESAQHAHKEDVI